MLKKSIPPRRSSAAPTLSSASSRSRQQPRRQQQPRQQEPIMCDVEDPTTFQYDLTALECRLQASVCQAKKTAMESYSFCSKRCQAEQQFRKLHQLLLAEDNSIVVDANDNVFPTAASTQVDPIKISFAASSSTLSTSSLSFQSSFSSIGEEEEEEESRQYSNEIWEEVLLHLEDDYYYEEPSPPPPNHKTNKEKKRQEKPKATPQQRRNKTPVRNNREAVPTPKQNTKEKKLSHELFTKKAKQQQQRDKTPIASHRRHSTEENLSTTLTSSEEKEFQRALQQFKAENEKSLLQRKNDKTRNTKKGESIFPIASSSKHPEEGSLGSKSSKSFDAGWQRVWGRFKGGNEGSSSSLQDSKHQTTTNPKRVLQKMARASPSRFKDINVVPPNISIETNKKTKQKKKEEPELPSSDQSTLCSEQTINTNNHRRRKKATISARCHMLVRTVSVSSLQYLPSKYRISGPAVCHP